MAVDQASRALDHARHLLQTIPLVDGHNDLPWVIHSSPAAQKSVKKYDLARLHSESDTDLPRLKEGMVKMSPLNPVVPADAAKAFEEKKKAISEGKFHPFQGPIKDQSGAIKVAAGAVMPLKDLLSINYYVQGVEGSVPK